MPLTRVGYNTNSNNGNNKDKHNNTNDNNKITNNNNNNSNDNDNNNTDDNSVMRLFSAISQQRTLLCVAAFVTHSWSKHSYEWP